MTDLAADLAAARLERLADLLVDVDAAAQFLTPEECAEYERCRDSVHRRSPVCRAHGPVHVDRLAVWTHLTPANLLDFQRRTAWESLGERVLQLHREGYRVDRDRVLDEMLERRREWEQPQP